MLCEDKLPESTGDKLTAWGDGSNFPGGARLDSLGEVLRCTGSNSTGCLICRRGTILAQDCRGCLLRMRIYCWRLLRSAGGYSTSLRLTVTLLGESVLTCWLTLWGIKMSGYVL